MTKMYKLYGLLLVILFGSSATIFAQCPPTAGAIAGPAIACVGQTASYTDPTATAGGTWSLASGGAFASINPATGVLTGIATGFVVVQYTVITCSSASTTFGVVVNPVPAPITNPGPVCDSSNIVLSDATPSGSWTSANLSVATIDPSLGVVYGASAGTAVISYTVSGCSVTTIVTSNPLPSAITGPDTLCYHGTGTFASTPAGGTWSSLNPGLVSINAATGAAIADTDNNPGTYIFYRAPNTCSTYVPMYVAVIQPTQPVTGAFEVCQGAAINFADGSTGGIWSATGPGSVSISVSGFTATVTGLTSGVDSIYYTRNFCPTQGHVLSIDPLPATITGPTAVCLGHVTNLSDASTGGTWASTNPLVLVSPTGSVSSAASGITDTIVYTLPTGCSTYVIVNVGTPPSGITGVNTACVGDSTMLSCVDTGGVWSSTSLAIANVVDTSGLVHGVSAGTVNISYTFRNGCFVTEAYTVNPLVVPSVTISGPTGINCAGTVDTFIAHPVNGGAATYRWEKFGIPFVPSGSVIINTDTLIYPAIHGDVVMCYMTLGGVCAAVDSVGDSMAVNVYPDSVVPRITITTSGPDSVGYIGQVFTFFSSVTYGGTAPTYQWFVNHKPIYGATNSSFAPAIYRNDTVFCIVTSNAPCPGAATFDTSNKIWIYTGNVGVASMTGYAPSLMLAPNPNNGVFTLNGNLDNTAGNAYATMEVLNVLGQTIMSREISTDHGVVQEAIILNDTPPGSYLLRVHTAGGTECFHFIISH